MYSQEQYQVHLQNSRSVRVKLDWLSWAEHKIDSLEGKLIDGSITLDRKSPIRRTCSLAFVTDGDKFIPSPTNYIWLNRKFRLWVGVDSLITGEPVWFDKGIFILDTPSLSYSKDDNSLTLSGLDKMCLYDGTLNGQLLNPIIIPEGTDINVALRTTLQSLGGETKFNMDTIGRNLPYAIERNAGETIYEVLKEIAELYMDWSEIYFDEKGFFRFEKNKERTNDGIVWDFSQTPLVLNYRNDPNFRNIKNHIQVWGHLHENGTQIQATLSNNDPNSDFAISKIGRRNLPITDDRIYTTEQAQIRCEWELKNHSSFGEKIGVSTVPIYMLDVNNVVRFDNKKTGIQGLYLIERLNLGLRHDNTLDIDAYKIYP